MLISNIYISPENSFEKKTYAIFILSKLMGKNCRVGYNSKYRFDSVLQPDQTCIRGIYDIDLSQLEIPRSHCMPILYPRRLTWSHM